MIIAIDGPAASGKGTVAKLLAQKLDFLALDTGAIYRAISVCIMRGKDLDNAVIEIKCDEDKKTMVFLDNEDITEEIRTIKVGAFTPSIANKQYVQDRVRKIQHEIAKNNNIIVEGRETTSVAFPNADFKFYVTADLEERAKRRHTDFVNKGEKITYEEVLELTRKRDQLDTEREIAPLIKVEGAIEINTTGRVANEVVDEMLSIIL